MKILDELVAAVTPEPSADERAEARAHLRQRASTSPWVTSVLDHHEQLEAAFAAVKAADSATAQRSAQKQLALLLTGHSVAEEVVLYPAMALSDQKGHSTAAYTEQSAAKVQIAALDDLEPLSEDYLDKLEHLRAAVSHHMYEEESKWFPELSGTGDSSTQARLTARYAEEFDRYTGASSRSGGDAAYRGA